jgi:hypothetical protein
MRDDLFDRLRWAAIWFVGFIGKEASSVATDLFSKVTAFLHLE